MAPSLDLNKRPMKIKYVKLTGLRKGACTCLVRYSIISKVSEARVRYDRHCRSSVESCLRREVRMSCKKITNNDQHNLYFLCNKHRKWLNAFTVFISIIIQAVITKNGLTLRLLKPGPPRQCKPITGQNRNKRFQHFQIQPIKCRVQNNEISTCLLTGDEYATMVPITFLSSNC